MFPAPIVWLRPERLWKRLARERPPHAIIFPLRSLRTNKEALAEERNSIRLKKKICGFINFRIRVYLVWLFNRNFRFSQHVHDKYRTFAHLLEVGLWLQKSSWLRTCRDLILLLFLLGIHEVEVCYPSLSLLEHWCQHLCLVNPDRSNWTKLNKRWRKLSLSGSIMYQHVFRKKKLLTVRIAFKASATKWDSLFVLKVIWVKFLHPSSIITAFLWTISSAELVLCTPFLPSSTEYKCVSF